MLVLKPTCYLHMDKYSAIDLYPKSILILNLCKDTWKIYGKVSREKIAVGVYHQPNWGASSEPLWRKEQNYLSTWCLREDQNEKEKLNMWLECRVQKRKDTSNINESSEFQVDGRWG